MLVNSLGFYGQTKGWTKCDLATGKNHPKEKFQNFSKWGCAIR